MKTVRAKALVGTTISLLILLTACAERDPNRPVPLVDPTPSILLENPTSRDAIVDMDSIGTDEYNLTAMKVQHQEYEFQAHLMGQALLSQPGHLEPDFDESSSQMDWGKADPAWRKTLKIYVPQSIQSLDGTLSLKASRQAQFQFFADYKIMRLAVSDIEQNVDELEDVVFLHDFLDVEYSIEDCMDCYDSLDLTQLPVIDTENNNAKVYAVDEGILIQVKVASDQGETLYQLTYSKSE
tara:strand:+ start:172134 stop:172850 length:717 start_codon:yes stop_codon:yes gene_type:complete